MRSTENPFGGGIEQRNFLEALTLRSSRIPIWRFSCEVFFLINNWLNRTSKSNFNYYACGSLFVDYSIPIHGLHGRLVDPEFLSEKESKWNKLGSWGWGGLSKGQAILIRRMKNFIIFGGPQNAETADANACSVKKDI